MKNGNRIQVEQRTQRRFPTSRYGWMLASVLLMQGGESAWAGLQDGMSFPASYACSSTPCPADRSARKDDNNKDNNKDNNGKAAEDHTPVNRTDSVISDPDDNISVDVDGALKVSSKTSKPYHISKTATENAAIRLPKDQGVDISDDVSTLQYIDRKGDAKLLVKTLGGKKQVEVANGDVEVHSAASGNTIPLLSANGKPLGEIATQTSQDSVRINRSPALVKFHIDSGKVKYRDSGQGTGVTLFRGENVKVNNGATIEKVTFGSADGLQNASGDPLPQRPGYAPNTVIPYLDGKLARFSDQLSLLDILQTALRELTGLSNGTLYYDAQSGVVSFVAGRRGLRLIPLGEVQVLLNQLAAASVATTASGAFSLASQGIQMTLAGAVGYFADLQQVIKTIDSNGQVTLRPNGALEFQLNSARYIAVPSAEANLPDSPTPLPGFDMAGDGVASFRDRLGTVQLLYPAFADTDQLTATISQSIPGAGLTPKGNGTYGLNSAGHSYTLMPEYAIRMAPDTHPTDRWWTENGLFYLRNADNTVQGLRIR